MVVRYSHGRRSALSVIWSGSELIVCSPAKLLEGTSSQCQVLVDGALNCISNFALFKELVSIAFFLGNLPLWCLTHAVALGLQDV